MAILKHLNHVPEDIEDLLKKIEKSYNISFEANELSRVRTFGQLCDQILLKIKYQNADDCTSQQAFYKLREAIVALKQCEKSSIRTDTTLSSIFPRRHRREQIANIETALGFKISILRQKHWVTWVEVTLFMSSIVILYFNWRIGLLILVLSVFLGWSTSKTGKEFDENTVGQFAEKIARENYLKSRRNQETINRNEIVQKIKQLFMRDLLLDEKDEITADTIIVD